MEDFTPKQMKGFNAGYELAKHEPELFKKLMSSLKDDSEYVTGLKLGSKQYDQEMLLQQLKQSQNKTKDRGGR